MDPVSSTRPPRAALRRARAGRARRARPADRRDRRRHARASTRADLTTRQINLELRWLLYEQGVTRGDRAQPGRPALARRRASSRAAGSPSRAASATSRCGMIDGPEVHITGRVGWSACENMMSGVVVIDGNAGSLTGAALRGGDIVVKGQVGARTGIDQKGGTIIVLGDAGSMTGFMMQRGRQIICGDVGPGLGDSMYDGAIYVGGKVKSLGHRLRPGRVDRRRHRADRAQVPRSTGSAAAAVPEVRLRQEALQLRRARALRAQARALEGGQAMADENAPVAAQPARARAGSSPPR